VVPPTGELRAIAEFLDGHGRAVRRLIDAKRWLIDLFNEQKQALIHRAATRGLDPNVRLKPSGIDWLADVPEHWEIVKLRRLVTLKPSKSESRSNTDDGEVVFPPMERVSEDGKIYCAERRRLKEVWTRIWPF
jgi:type I restriction enzyme, S subunit